MKDRKPRTIVMLIELEDNCGAVLAKKKIEIPVKMGKPGLPDEPTARRLFDEWTQRLQAGNPEMEM